MKIPPPIHRWSVTPKSAIALQKKLADRVRVRPLRGKVRLASGADLAFSKDGAHCLAGVVVWDIERREIIEEQLAWRPARFPYVPGLLSFREIPAVLAAVRKLKTVPDVFLFDGQGLAHPRRIGLASHAGLLIDRPSIGCAKSRLCGTHDEPPLEAGGSVPLVHQDEIVGAVLRTRSNVKPLYISVGHDVTLEDACRIILACTTRYRLPEPTRQAHVLVTRHRGER